MANTRQTRARSADTSPAVRFERDRRPDDIGPRETLRRQREKFGGLRWGSAFFGWLVAGALLGAEYNVLSQLNLPRIPIDEGSLTTGGLVALAAMVLGTLVAAVAGGKAGTHFHRKIDRAGLA